MSESHSQSRKIFIGVPVYNEEKYILAALQSIQEQSWDDFIVVISDNASTDRTPEICNDFCKDDDRFHYICQDENIGAAKNFNYLFTHSNSKYFMWLGAHDYIHQDFLKIHIKFLDSNSEYVISYSFNQFIDEQGVATRVTSAGDYEKYNDFSSWERYFQFMSLGGECILINHVIRRNAMCGFDFHAVRSWDRILLSRLFFKGLFHCTKKSLYYCREFGNRKISEYDSMNEYFNDSIIRITGDANAKVDNIEFYKVWLLDAIALESSILKRLILIPRFLWQLDKRYQISPFSRWLN